LNYNQAAIISIVEKWDDYARSKNDVERRRQIWTILYALDAMALGQAWDNSKALEVLKDFKPTAEVEMVREMLEGK